MAEPLDTGRFDNRKEAGLKLAGRLGHLRDQNVVVLALPRGGVPVAAEVARSLDAPLDLILVRKVGLPSQPELALGAIAGDDGGSFVMNPEVAAVSGLDAGAISNLAEAERAELRRRKALYLAHYPHVPLGGRVVVLVDDGLATGATMVAAIQAVRKAAPARVVVAVPVASTETIGRIRPLVDDLVSLQPLSPFGAVGMSYRDFPQVSDDEVVTLLASARGT